MNKLLQEIEDVRKQLNQSLENGYDEEKCYGLSVELDRLIEQYIQLPDEAEDASSGITPEEMPKFRYKSDNCI